MEYFDLDIARKILAGEIVGGFITRDEEPAEIICILDDNKFAGKTTRFPIVAMTLDEGDVCVNTYTEDGMFYDDGDTSGYDLFITYDKRRKNVKRRDGVKFGCSNKTLQNILQKLLYTSPKCKIRGREEEGKKEVSGVYRAAGTLYACLGELEDVVEIDDIIMEEEKK
jgi:hypothetical protein